MGASGIPQQDRRKRPRPGHASLPVLQRGLRLLTAVRLDVHKSFSDLSGHKTVLFTRIDNSKCLLQAVFYNLSCPRSNICPRADCSPALPGVWTLVHVSPRPRSPALFAKLVRTSFLVFCPGQSVSETPPLFLKADGNSVPDTWVVQQVPSESFVLCISPSLQIITRSLLTCAECLYKKLC